MHTQNAVSLIISELRKGAKTGSTLSQTLGVSQPTVSRLLGPLIQDGTVASLGAARARIYAASRAIERVETPLPVTQISADGRPHSLGTLYSIAPEGFAFVPTGGGAVTIYDGLPWFLFDSRPQGFIGRNFPMIHPDLELPSRIDRWSDSDVMRAIANRGEDLPGDLVVGTSSFDRLTSIQPTVVLVGDRESEYARLANESMQGTRGGSSAAGEHPKFCVLIQESNRQRSVIVKFSPADDSPAATRTRDLLRCEHLALRSLESGGRRASTTEITESAGRVFLEVNRFDRTEIGRISLISLTAVEAEFVGAIKEWAELASDLMRLNLISHADARAIAFQAAFGTLIGDTDMHQGNISFSREGSWTEAKFKVCPAYDVLPMMYAPVSGEIVERDFLSRRAGPSALWLEVWPDAVDAAAGFWSDVQSDTTISEGFREMTQPNEDHVRRM